MASMNISLTPELMKAVQSRVKSGYYNNASEVIRDAIRRMDYDDEIIYQYKLDRLRKTLEPAIKETESGIFADYNLKNFLKEIEDEI